MSRPCTFDVDAVRALFARGETRPQVAKALGIPKSRLERRLSLWAAAGQEMPGDGKLRRRLSPADRKLLRDGHKPPRESLARCHICRLLEPHECVRRAA